MPNEVFPRVELGKVLGRRGEIAAAQQVYEGAIFLEPQNYLLHYRLGRTRRLLPDPAGAAESFTQALRLHPRHVPSAIGLGEALYEQGMFDLAGQAYSAALAVDPQNEEAVNGLARIRGRVVERGVE